MNMNHTDKKPLGYWNNKQICHQAALNCLTRTEFRKKYSAAYKNCLKNGWLNDVCKHLRSKQCPRGYWHNIDNCRQAALSCKTMKEFREKFSGAYHVCYEKGWLQEVCSDLRVLRDIHKWAKKDDIINEARKYGTRSEFNKKNGSAYQAAIRMGILDEACNHMPHNGNFCTRGIYAFEFPDNTVYVGLTYNFVKRKCDHLKHYSSKVFQHIQKTGLTPIFKILHDYIGMSEAKELEGRYLSDYVSKGWRALNVQKTGNLGGSAPFYTHKRVISIASSCETLLEFRTKYDQAYQAARKHRWLDEIKKTLPAAVNQYGSFQNTYDEVMSFARKCKTYREFMLGNPSASDFAKRNGFINEIYKILPPKVKGKSIKKFSLKMVMDNASKSENYNDFRNKYGSAYNAALRNGWLNEVKTILTPKFHTPYTKDEIFTIAKSVNSYSEFIDYSNSMYNAALKNGWLDEIKNYFGIKEVHSKYTLEDILDVAKRCESYTEFRNHTSVYSAARHNGWLVEVKKIVKSEVHDSYTKDSVLQLAKKCKTYKEFQINYSGAYNAARINHWLEDIELLLPRKQRRPFSKEYILELAKGYTTLREFSKKHRYECKAAYRNGWKEELLQIISKEGRTPYTKEEILEIATKCSSYKQFRTEYSSAYTVSVVKNWLNDVQEIIPSKKRKPYSKQEIFECVMKCNDYTSFCKEYRNVYKAATKKHLLDEIKLFFESY